MRYSSAIGMTSSCAAIWKAVRRRVDDRTPRAHVLRAELVDDRGAGGGIVAERPAPDAALELGDHVSRKTVREGREGALEHDAGELPVAGDRILPGRALAHAAECA